MEGAELQAIRAGVQAKGYGTDTVPAQNLMVNSVYRRILGMRRWPFLAVANDTTLSLALGVNTVDLAAGIADMLHIDALRVMNEPTQPENFIVVDYKPPQQFRDLEHRYPRQGVPQHWTKINDIARIWPTPDRVYDLSIDYTQRPPDLVLDTDKTVFPAVYQDAVEWGVVAEMAFRQRDLQGYDVAKNEHGTRIVDMMNEYGVRQRQTATEVVRSGTYDYLQISDPLLWQIS